MKTKFLPIAAAVVALLFIVGQAAAVGPSKCTGMKFKATGKKTRARAACYVKAGAKHATVDGKCLSKATSKFSASFAKAETQSSCNGGTGDTSALESKVDAFVDDVRDIVISGGSGPSRCDSKKISASVKEASAKSRCYAKGATKGINVDPYCLSKAEAKFSSAISQAELKGGCTHTGQADVLESAVNSFIDDIVSELNPPPPTTTTSSTTTPTSPSTTTTLGPLPSCSTDADCGSSCSSSCGVGLCAGNCDLSHQSGNVCFAFGQCMQGTCSGDVDCPSGTFCIIFAGDEGGGARFCCPPCF